MTICLRIDSGGRGTSYGSRDGISQREDSLLISLVRSRDTEPKSLGEYVAKQAFVPRAETLRKE